MIDFQISSYKYIYLVENCSWTQDSDCSLTILQSLTTRTLQSCMRGADDALQLAAA